jgi:hypothetical protein
MSSTSNYNAITNLTETIIDYLVADTAEINNAVVENLDCNVGIIDTFSSTTATLTSANIQTLTSTTSTITNLNTNNIQSTPTSSTVSLYTTGTGLLTIGNTSNTNPLAIDSSAILATNKNLTLQGTGKITTPNILVSGLTGSKIVKTDASDNLVSSLYDETTLPVSTPQQTALNLKSNIDNPTFTTGIGLTSGNITISSGNLNCNTIRPLSTGATISLFSTSTGAINFGNFFSSNPFNISTDVVLSISRSLTLSGVGKITTPGVLVSGLTASKIVKTDASDNLVSSLYDETTLPVSTPQQTALNLKANIDNPTFTTGIGLTSGNLTISSGNLICNNIQPTTAGSMVNLYTTSTGLVILGNSSNTNPLSVDSSLSIGINKNLSLSGTGKISSPGILVSGLTASKLVLTDASKNLVSSAYDETSLPVSTATQTALNLKSNINAPVFTSSIGLTSGNLTISSGKILNNTYTALTTSADISLGESGDLGSIRTLRDLYIGSSGVPKGIVCNVFYSQVNTDSISFGLNQTSGNITIGNSTPALDSGTLTINKNITVATNKNLTLQGTGKITTPNILVSGLTASRLVLTDASDNLVSSSYNESNLISSNGVNYSDFPYWNTYTNSWQAQTTGRVNIGKNAGSTGQGSFAISIGEQSGFQTQGFGAISVGYSAGAFSQRTGALAVGNAAGSLNQGTNSIALGTESGYNAKGENSISLGYQSGYSNQAVNAISIGKNSGRINQAQNSISIGELSGNSAQGQYSIGIGYEAQRLNAGTDSVSIGTQSGVVNQGANSVSIGRLCGTSGQAQYSISIGYQAGNYLQQTACVALGYQSGQSSQGQLSVSIGNNAGSISQASNCIALGSVAGYNQQKGNSICIGFQAGRENANQGSVSIGYYAGHNFVGTNTIAIGNSAGYTQSASSQESVFIGSNAGSVNGGDYATSVGSYSGQVGQGSLACAFGHRSGNTNQGGSAIAIGHSAGALNQGANSIAIGKNAGPNSQGAGSIIINASGSVLDGSAGQCFIKPIANPIGNNYSDFLFYDPATSAVSTMSGGQANGLGIDGTYRNVGTALDNNATYMFFCQTDAGDGTYCSATIWSEEPVAQLTAGNNILLQFVATRQLQMRSGNGVFYGSRWRLIKIIQG